jgi:hypothetical protein
MSFVGSGRKIRSKIGNSFPGALNTPGGTDATFAEVISAALRAEFGRGPSAVKIVARLANANERTVRNWFDAKNGPNGESLVPLIRSSDGVLQAVLELAGRQNLRVAIHVKDLRQRLAELIAAIDDVHA